MKLFYHRTFKKQYKKLNKKELEKLKEQIRIFEKEPFHQCLNNHALKGKYMNHRSINIAGDLRVIYKSYNNGVMFTDIGTHSELYG